MMTDLALLLLLAAAPPLVCPAGTALQGGFPPDQYEAWCAGRPDAFGNLRRHGPSVSWYDDGTRRIEEVWFEGKRDGPFVEYHRNGQRARAGTYQRDDKVGTWTIWFESGALEERSDFVRNVPHGPFTAWYRTGPKRAEGRYCLGAQCGTWVSYDERGRELGRAEYTEQRTAP